MADDAEGEILRSGVRYLMMRPDVLMGVAHELPDREAALFLQALEQSAFRNAQASFQQYRVRAQPGADELLRLSLSMAAHLGWGVWSIDFARATDAGRAGPPELIVRNSPFAAGYGASSFPVCSAIAGALKAILLVAYGTAVEVREIACTAQGAPACRFTLSGPILPKRA